MISIIIPTYLDDERLYMCLKSIDNQSLDKSEFEVIVINNCPKKDISINLKEFRKLNLQFFDEPLKGSYAARNMGIEKSTGEILAFTDSDCIVGKDWLLNAKEIFEDDRLNRIGVLTGPVDLIFKDNNSLSDAEIYEKYTAFTTESYAKDGFAITANWFSYRFVIDEFGKFNSSLMSNGDSELSGKISSKYFVKFSSNIIIYHPARYKIPDLVNKYRRIVGGTFVRKFYDNKIGFFSYIVTFVLRRFRFSIKKIFTVSFKESFSICLVCFWINIGVLIESVYLILGREPRNL
ncbi:Glycosyl transferase family 2 [Cyclobacterium lianum]|uniref:Glycosyl transferase family 2 n=1 Tax=Cyclobacterium lianum TaxID=388280 RepID=A0A1M7QL12_9BACT|nr:glycosyltransferase family 2 protein [Cyclobacterium lianum]SHN31782.1 Glycosyl transferase family 2 [Cyclobacterium lianum]